MTGMDLPKHLSVGASYTDQKNYDFMRQQRDRALARVEELAALYEATRAQLETALFGLER